MNLKQYLNRAGSPLVSVRYLVVGATVVSAVAATVRMQGNRGRAAIHVGWENNKLLLDIVHTKSEEMTRHSGQLLWLLNEPPAYLEPRGQVIPTNLKGRAHLELRKNVWPLTFDRHQLKSDKTASSNRESQRPVGESFTQTASSLQPPLSAIVPISEPTMARSYVHLSLESVFASSGFAPVHVAALMPRPPPER